MEAVLIFLNIQNGLHLELLMFFYTECGTHVEYDSKMNIELY